MQYQPTREDVARVRQAQQVERQAHAALAEAQYRHTVASQELAAAVEDMLRGPLNAARPLSVTAPSQHRRTGDRAADHPSL